jgi:hypothetical protein
MAQTLPTDWETRLDEYLASGQRSVLITEPLSSHSVETMLAVCRAAIANGEDVNAPDTLPHVGFNKGRPLDACLQQTHMPGRKSIIKNLLVIKLLLEHGADPWLYSRSVGIVQIPMLLAKRHSVMEDESEENRAFWVHLLKLFEEAIIRIDAKKKKAEEDKLN